MLNETFETLFLHLILKICWKFEAFFDKKKYLLKIEILQDSNK